MREMILNDVSCVVSSYGVPANAPVSPDAKALEVLIDLAQGMAELVSKMAVPKMLRLQRAMESIQLTQESSLLDLLFQLQRSKSREEARFWLSLSQKMPLLTDLPVASVDRFHAFEADPKLGAAAKVLMLCVQESAIAISFPILPEWDKDQLDVAFTELLADGSIEPSSEPIDNLARSVHVQAILARHQQQNFADLTPANFWQNRGKVFPALCFGQDIAAHIESTSGHFWTIMRRLADLNASAAAWKSGPAPDWKTKVSPESTQTSKNAKLLKKRKFRDTQGVTQDYEWHARYGNSGRIHLRFDAANHTVEVGYIGPHLPL